MDFSEFIEDSWRIEQRSTSLSNFDKTRLIEIIKFMPIEIDDWNIYRELGWDEYQNARSGKNRRKYGCGLWEECLGDNIILRARENIFRLTGAFSWMDPMTSDVSTIQCDTAL